MKKLAVLFVCVATVSYTHLAHTQQINPIEKVVELYERLLKSEQEKIEILRECIKQGK